MADRKAIYSAVVETPLGRIGIRADRVLHGIDFLSSRSRLKVPSNPLSRQVCRQLRRYFSNPNFRFRLPVDAGGSNFQNRVWRIMQRIPTGRVRSYGDVARQLGSGPRAVGNACRANPVPIVVPCHRIVAASGLGGFMGSTGGRSLAIKRWLLNHEGRR